MARRERSAGLSHTYKLDRKPYANEIKKAGKTADRVLRRYGKAVISLTNLRNRVDSELGSTSLTELILRERETRY